ncbi:lanthionine synthetase LanC family protein [Thermosipho sp. 1070]|uniref:lanthionine synthetase LanC family protein n=1 Tax=Thermosipho sp. 1070 TaxID=1437364 RepID=UPI0009494B71|nr:lanthionine synthetase LanC family protein [Thermosipho sp. 1070]ANQ54577.1 hypothetical protein Y592_03375 [Thermosipho sp. 1070]
MKKRYRILEAVHFSNSGGVYKAFDELKRCLVIIKEARPFTNQSFDEKVHSVDLLEKEWKILKYLERFNFTPKPVDFFKEWEHYFLVEEFVNGYDIRELIFRKYNPSINPFATKRDSEKFLKMFFKIFRSFLEVVQVLHDKGILLGDISARNILFKKNTYKAILIDLEGAVRKYIDTTVLTTPGFSKYDINSNRAYSLSDELYSIGSIMFYYIYPITVFSVLRDDIFKKVYKEIVDDIGWPKEIYYFICDLQESKISLDDALNFFENNRHTIREKVSQPFKMVNDLEEKNDKNKLFDDITKKYKIKDVLDGLTNFLYDVANLSTQTLFPCDPIVYSTNEISFGFGAGGILYSISKYKNDIPKRFKNWFLNKVKNIDFELFPPGFLTGLSGIVFVLLELGEIELANWLMERCNKHQMLYEDYSLYYGASGVGLTNLKMYRLTKEEKYLSEALKIYKWLIKHAKYDKFGKIFWENSFSKKNTFYGLGYGAAGISLFLLRLYEVVKDPKIKKIGEKAINDEILRSSVVFEGLRSFYNGKNYEPYLEVGTSGVLKVALRYDIKNKIFEELLNDLRRKYFVLPGYLFGTTGIIDTLIDIVIYYERKDILKVLEQQIEGLINMHIFNPKSVCSFKDERIKQEKVLAVLGEGGIRITCDFGTGIAGVLRTLNRLLKGKEDELLLD